MLISLKCVPVVEHRQFWALRHMYVNGNAWLAWRGFTFALYPCPPNSSLATFFALLPACKVRYYWCGCICYIPWSILYILRVVLSSLSCLAYWTFSVCPMKGNCQLVKKKYGIIFKPIGDSVIIIKALKSFEVKFEQELFWFGFARWVKLCNLPIRFNVRKTTILRGLK